ncbi:hypothetical protein BGZ81_007717 [Podila clonocystis]|nr:hypothetical protein BGZ81_007717 [Podila clonocystis]
MVNALMVFNVSTPGSVCMWPSLQTNLSTLSSTASLFHSHYRVIGSGFSYLSHRTPFHVFVKTLTGKTIRIPCSLEETINQIKDHILDREDIPTDAMRLIHIGSPVLANDHAHPA